VRKAITPGHSLLKWCEGCPDSIPNTWLSMKVYRWRRRPRRLDFTKGCISHVRTDLRATFPLFSLLHAPGKKATIPIYKVLLRSRLKSKSRLTSTEADTKGWSLPWMADTVSVLSGFSFGSCHPYYTIGSLQWFVKLSLSYSSSLMRRFTMFWVFTLLLKRYRDTCLKSVTPPRRKRYISGITYLICNILLMIRDVHYNI